MYLGIPQIIFSLIMILGLAISMVNHGKPKTGKDSFWVTLVGQSITFVLLYWGGFFG